MLLIDLAINKDIKKAKDNFEDNHFHNILRLLKWKVCQYYQKTLEKKEMELFLHCAISHEN